MVSTFVWKQAPFFGHISEPSQVTLSGSKHTKLLLQCPKLWLSYIGLCRKECRLPFDGFQVIVRQKMGSSIAFIASSLKEDTLITLHTSLEESSFKMAAEKAYKSPSVEPFSGFIMDSISLKPHPSRRRLFPANEAPVTNDSSNALSGSKPCLPLPNGNYTTRYTDGPSTAVVMCLECLELTGSHLGKCLKHASSVDEEDVIGLLKTLSSYGFQRSDIKAMLSKYPSLVKVQGPQALQWCQYVAGLGFSKSVVISLLLRRPALVACELKCASQVIDYFLSVGTSKEDLIAMIACRPHVIEHDVVVVKGIVTALMKASLDQSDINKLIRKAPTVFTVSLEDIEGSLLFWSKVGVEGKALCRAILRRPNLLSYNTESMLNTYRYLQLWIKPGELTKLVSRFAELLAYDPQTKLKPLIDYFLELGLSEREVVRVICRRPQIMSCTLERLKKVTTFLIGLGLDGDMVGKVLIASPQVFTLNAEDKLKRGVEFFQSMGLDRERDVEFVFVRCAQLFCCSIEKNLLPTFKFLSNIGLKKESLSKMIAAFPSMLGQNVELSLAPKYEFLIGEMKRTNKELVEFPQYFGYSLEGRIKPRHNLLAERGLCRSLPSMLACTDNDFFKRYVEPYSPLPQERAKWDAREQLDPAKHKPRKTKVLTPPHKTQLEPVQQDRSHSPFENHSIPEPNLQKTLSMDHGPEVAAAECPTQDNWGFLDAIPKLHEQQGQLHPASFRKLYKNPIPCGIWIHAYKSDM